MLIEVVCETSLGEEDCTTSWIRGRVWTASLRHVK